MRPRPKKRAQGALDWLREQWESGKRRRLGWTELDLQRLTRLRSLYYEWEQLSAEGPPELKVYLQFMERFLPAYNAFYRSANRALCRECFGLYKVHANRAEGFCSQRCARIDRSRPKPGDEAKFQARWDRHRTRCSADCIDGNPCAEFLAAWNASRNER